jgi:hypothetical protein
VNVRIAAVCAGTLACTYPKLPLLGDGGPTPDGRMRDGQLPDGQVTDGGSGSGSGPGSGPGSGSGVGSGSGCPLSASYDVVFTPGSGNAVGDEEAENFGSSDPPFTQTLIWEGNISTTPPASVVIELFAGAGSQSPDWPVGGVTPRSGIDLSTSVDAGVLIAGTSINGSDTPAFGYVAIAGTLNITQVSPLAGTVTGLSFQQWDNLFNGGQEMQDPDGCTTAMPSINYDAPVSAGSGVTTGAAPRPVAER